jgi:predicted  nucleic acid-binding Zn-ribbon protein
MDVDQVLVSVQERDKWKRRLELLEHSLADVKQRKARLETRLRRVKRDLARLDVYAEAVLSQQPRLADARGAHAARDARIPAR